MSDYPIVERTVRLNCDYSSATMCAHIRKAVGEHESAVVFLVGGERADASDLVALMLTACGPSKIRIQACGPDAKAAVSAVVKLFPRDGGPQKCVFPFCEHPAVLLQPLPAGGFAYRCAISTMQHCWFRAARRARRQKQTAS